MHATRGDGFFDLQKLDTFEQVYAALGGPKKICALTGRSRASVSNWRKAQQFPAEHYCVMRNALLEDGYVADLRVWAFTSIEKLPRSDVVAA